MGYSAGSSADGSPRDVSYQGPLAAGLWYKMGVGGVATFHSSGAV